MAMANRTDPVEAGRESAQVVPLPRHSPPPEPTSTKYKERAAEILRTTRDSARTAYAETRRQAVEGYSRAVEKAQDLATRTKIRARQAKEEHPVQLIAIAFGAAFIVGIALRIWRARAS